MMSESTTRTVYYGWTIAPVTKRYHRARGKNYPRAVCGAALDYAINTVPPPHLSPCPRCFP